MAPSTAGQGGITAVPDIIAAQIMGKHSTNAGSSLHPAPMSPTRATLDQYLSNENVPSWEETPAMEVALILHYFQVFLW